MYNRQPNSHHCFVCGLQNPVGLKLAFYDNGVDEVRCEYAIPAEYNSYPGVAHGGIIAAILDEAVGRVAMIGDHNHFMMTAKMELKYRRPVPVNTPLVIIGRKVKMRPGGRIAQAIGEVRLPDGTMAVEAELTLVDLPDEFRVNGDLEALGWKVYS
jgi:acyl-coenzyme A thioesterase PaaI-like protein